MGRGEQEGGGGGKERKHSFYAPPLPPGTYLFAITHGFVPFMCFWKCRLVNMKICFYLQFLQKPSLLNQYVSRSCQAERLYEFSHWIAVSDEDSLHCVLRSLSMSS